ncbi:HNH endonuclease family protein [Streptomyces antimycoticus]|uniref:HNH endonuclease family protein n=1 Tax=Streptomyces antimycoticus TaxID=68175 RepID=UPI000A3A029C|nr:HNH endonuclease family protein [Streptomyces antimycoticus]WTA82115.1 HNH endonuclease family protein [Streptomyces antimycoticus]WTB07361.1 HNH endonuclease family protein [Streptomyces antimycoticus]
MRSSVAVLVALLAAGGCKAGDQDGDQGGGKSGGASSAPTASGPALTAVSSLTVKGRAPKTGYERSEFGSSWVDTDDNGCGTRDDILKRDLKDVRFRDGHCLVASGTLTDDPYTGRDVRFVRGHSKVDIDHVVALSDAWQKGAQKWDRDKRLAFANDPLNLIAVDASANRRKGDGDAATWLPPNKAYRCDYVAHQVAVKKAYGLWVTEAEKGAMKRVLGGCPTAKLPARSGGR